ncbi:hypothetical protein DVK85_00320 [Flavobacterium arcticum]|uniref:Outer membrane protein beta-barrel domain-containing protein n=1 Tax=Flavobacterium arcticum TaxID=1784713 RepID=A0A345H849_9FLAO|nr:hypothetical protein [Flavobacterium arcticum]AXG72759.1 hypothetical protein DVK85_00320 [Flavobacterium arcticum]KAF2510971.1 hypothetical protein E0W72_06150 [Flavobacterium arcticum]
MKKNMIFKGLILGVLFFLGTSNIFAQEINGTSNESINNYDQKFRLGFGLNAGPAIGDYFNLALGGDVRLQYDLTQRTSLTLTTGYTHLFSEEDYIDDLGYIPVKAGFKAFVLEDNFYVLGEVGAGFAVTNDYNETTFIWAPGVGYANEYIDLSVRYEGMNDFKTDQVALRLAYGFKL